MCLMMGMGGGSCLELCAVHTLIGVMMVYSKVMFLAACVYDSYHVLHVTPTLWSDPTVGRR